MGSRERGPASGPAHCASEFGRAGAGRCSSVIPQTDNVRSYLREAELSPQRCGRRVGRSGQLASSTTATYRNHAEYHCQRGVAPMTSAHPASNFNATATVQYFNDTAPTDQVRVDETNPAAIRANGSSGRHPDAAESSP
jgi:hypothetical protein